MEKPMARTPLSQVLNVPKNIAPTSAPQPAARA